MISGASVIAKGSLTLRLDERKALVNGQDVKLSSKEFAILSLLVQNEGSEITYEQLYETVWDSPLNGDSCALRKQISRMKKKIGEEDSEDFSIFNEHGRGYAFVMLDGLHS